MEEVLRHAAELGYDGVELAPFTLARVITELSQERRRQIRDAAKRAGIEICGLHWLLAKTSGFHLTHPEASVRRATAEYLCELVECCAELRGKVMVLGSPQQRNVPAGVDAEQAREWAASTLTNAVRRAEERAVTICFEPLAATETNFINTAAEAVAFAERMASPAMKIVLDVKAMCAEGRPIPEIVLESGRSTAHFHANDQNLKGPGFGEIDFRPIASALRQIAYRGYVSVEVFDFSDGAETIAEKSLRYLRSVFDAECI
jgi:sugar phosphate isomerase/epimerase